MRAEPKRRWAGSIDYGSGSGAGVASLRIGDGGLNATWSLIMTATEMRVIWAPPHERRGGFLDDCIMSNIAQTVVT